MNRRGFLAALMAAGCTPQEAPQKGSKAQAAPTPERSKIPRVAILFYGSGTSTTVSSSSAIGVSPIALFRERLEELGYVEGTNILLEERYADGDPQRLQQLAQEIVTGNPDVIVAIAAAATKAARQATSTIPIVMAHAGDPVGAGWVKTLAKPGGNVTGTTSQIPDLGSKQVELLRELLPGLARLGVLANRTNSGTPPTLANVTEAARRFNIDVTVAEVTRTEDFDAALRLLSGARLDALYVMIEPMIYLNRQRVVDFAAASRLPASYDVGREIVRQGGLISFGPVLQAHYALAAEYVDKILKGARPADLPIQQPTQFALVVNLAAAKALGLAVPQSLLTRADEVIR
jgi:putative ABC transport system substrate-binding protein